MGERYDVIIIGAGAGGATAAYFLSHAGARVLVLEQAKLPRYKPCAGAVTQPVFDVLRLDWGGVIEREPLQVTYYWDGNEPASFPLTGRPARMVMRDRFDWHILREGRATVWDATPARAIEESSKGVTVTTVAGERVAADYLIGADGAYSLVARSLGLRRQKRLCAVIEAEVEPDSAVFEQYVNKAVFDLGIVKNGYLWIFAKRNHLSAGVAIMVDKGGKLRPILERGLEKLGIQLVGARLYGWTLPIYQGAERRSTPRTLLVGDAAGLVDPFTGEGIRHAVMSGRLAAQAILTGRVGSYSSAVERYAQQTLRPMIAAAKLFFRHSRFCYQYGVRNPRATRAWCNWLSGQSDVLSASWNMALSVAESWWKRV